MRASKGEPVDGRVGAFGRERESLSYGPDREHPAARRDDGSVTAFLGPSVVNRRAWERGKVEARDRVPEDGRIGISLGGDDDRQRGEPAVHGRPRRFLWQPPFGGPSKQLQPARAAAHSAAAHSIERDEDRGLGIAEAHVELEHDGLPLHHHDPREERPAKRRPLTRQPRQRRLDDAPHDGVVKRIRYQRRGRVRPHAPRVRAAIAIERTLVILRRRQRHEALAVRHDVEADLLAEQHLFDDDRSPGVAERALHHHLVDGEERLFGRLRDDDPFPRGEPVRLDHERAGGARNVLAGGSDVRGAEDLERGRRDLVALEEALHEGLRGFELRGGARRAERRNPCGGERVDEPERKWKLGADEDEVRARLRGEPDDAVHVVDSDGRVLADFERSGVPGSDHDVSSG